MELSTSLPLSFSFVTVITLYTIVLLSSQLTSSFCFVTSFFSSFVQGFFLSLPSSLSLTLIVFIVILVVVLVFFLVLRYASICSIENCITCQSFVSLSLCASAYCSDWRTSLFSLSIEGETGVSKAILKKT